MQIRAATHRMSGRIKSVSALMALAGGLAFLPVSSVLADSVDGQFPTADQVGGEVYIDPVGVGKKLPLDFDTYDLNGNKIDLAKQVAGKRTLVVFFISAVPVAVHELPKIENFAASKGVNLALVNADTVGTALMGGPKAAIPNTVKTMHMIKKEEKLRTTQLFVAPNDALSADGVSNRLGFRGLPTSFLINSSGVVEKVFVGPQNWQNVSL